MTRKIDIGLTALFGIFWLVFGLNGFFHFFSIPEPHGAALAFSNALNASGYVMPFVYGTQIICGLLLLVRRFVPLALLFLGPIVLNIMLYDVFLNHAGLTIGAMISGLYLFLLWQNRRSFQPLLTI